MGAKHTNLARTALSASITNVATSLTVNTGDGAKFPSISTPDFFYATIVDSANIPEIVQVTARATDTFTIVRAQGGTAARAWTTGATLTLFVTAETLDGKAGLGDKNVFTKAQIVTPVVAPIASGTTTYTPDVSTTNIFDMLIDNAFTMQTPTNPTNGQVVTFALRQGTTGGTVAWSTGFKWQNGAAPVASVGAGIVDMVTAMYLSSTGFWYASMTRGMS